MVRSKKVSSAPPQIFLKRGNITLARLLMLANQADPEGISTTKLFKQLGTTGYGQTTLKRALSEGLVERVAGERPGPGQFAPKYVKITEKGRALLSEQLAITGGGE